MWLQILKKDLMKQKNGKYYLIPVHHAVHNLSCQQCQQHLPGDEWTGNVYGVRKCQ